MFDMSILLNFQMAPVSLSSSSLNSRRDIIGLDDQEYGEDEENVIIHPLLH